MAARLRRGRLTPLGWAALLIGALIMLAPLLWTLLLSLKDNAELVGHSGAALHAPYTLENYARDLRQQPDAALAAQQRHRRARTRPPAC